MSIKSQEKNMRCLALLLSRDLGYLCGEKECGPNGDKRTFLNVGKTFLRALSKDLGLRDVKIVSNPGGIAVSGECTLIGMWNSSGIYIKIGQILNGKTVLYRTVRNVKDYTGGNNNYLTCADLKQLSYDQLLSKFLAFRKEEVCYERAA